MTTDIDQARLERAEQTTLEMANVSKVFGTGPGAVTALRGVDLRVTHGEFMCVLGASGCGKSTLLNIAAGLDEATSGTVTIAARRPSFMFQDAALLPWLTAGRNVELALHLAGWAKAERRRRSQELLELVRLDGVAGKRPHELSGGMRQRVSLARAIAAATSTGSGPQLLLMDEPFAALDAITRDMLQNELLRVWKATATTVLLVTHGVREAVRLAQRVVLLSSRPGAVVREWAVRGDRLRLHDEITGQLREVITRHAA